MQYETFVFVYLFVYILNEFEMVLCNVIILFIFT